MFIKLEHFYNVLTIMYSQEAEMTAGDLLYLHWNSPMITMDTDVIAKWCELDHMKNRILNHVKNVIYCIYLRIGRLRV